MDDARRPRIHSTHSSQVKTELRVGCGPSSTGMVPFSTQSSARVERCEERIGVD
jgi:hypothetical protein